MEHHDPDIDPIPNESKPLFINEPWLMSFRITILQPKQTKWFFPTMSILLSPR